MPFLHHLIIEAGGWTSAPVVRGATAPRRHDSRVWTFDALGRLVSLADCEGNAPSKTARGVTTCGYALLDRLTGFSGATTLRTGPRKRGMEIMQRVADRRSTRP